MANWLAALLFRFKLLASFLLLLLAAHFCLGGLLAAEGFALFANGGAATGIGRSSFLGTKNPERLFMHLLNIFRHGGCEHQRADKTDLQNSGKSHKR